MNLIETFQPSLLGRGDRMALCFSKRDYTFGDLNALSDRAAEALRERYDVAMGDRVAMYLGNCPELIIFYLAALKIGAITVPMNVLYRDRELTHLLTDAEPKVILTDAERWEVLQPLRFGFTFLENVFRADLSDLRVATDGCIPFSALTITPATGAVSVAGIDGDDPALMIYTSGTTGQSKGALLTHSNLAANIITLIHTWQWTEDDRFLLCLPLFHVHGLGNGFHGAMASGCSTILLPRFKADIVLEILIAEECTLFFGVPTMYERLLECAETNERRPESMRLYVSGSAPLSPDTFTRFESVFGHRILERYGMSETAMITSNPYAGLRLQGTVGKPLPGVSVRIVDETGDPIADEAAGEIQVKGPNVLKGYWRQPKKTRESYSDGWFKTGDLGRYSEEEYVIICGRTRELIITGGFNVYPEEVINCLTDHPAISEAAVVGVPDKARGELVKAYVVVTDDGVSAEEVMDYCREHLASFKVPKSVVFTVKLPRNAMGKLQLQDLPDRDRL